MSTRDDVGADALLKATHRPQPLLQMPMIPLKAVVEVLRAAMYNCRQDVAEGRGIARRRIRRNPRGAYAGLSYWVLLSDMVDNSSILFSTEVSRGYTLF